MTYPISNQQQQKKKNNNNNRKANQQRKASQWKQINRKNNLNGSGCSGFDLQRKSHVNLLPPPSDFTSTAEKGKKRLERKRGGGEMDNQQIESFQIKQRCKVNRESHTHSSSSRNWQRGSRTIFISWLSHSSNSHLPFSILLICQSHQLFLLVWRWNGASRT